MDVWQQRQIVGGIGEHLRCQQSRGRAIEAAGSEGHVGGDQDDLRRLRRTAELSRILVATDAVGD